MNSNIKYDVLIVGAGMSGLTAANYIQDRGLQVKILDKGKAVGGRLATKRIEYKNTKVTFDYGARFIEPDNTDFKNFMNNLLKKDIAKIWHINNAHNYPESTYESEKYIGKKSMREIAVHLSSGLNISNDVKVEIIKWENNEWNIITREFTYKAKTIILTMPNPQVLELLHRSEINIPDEKKSELEKVQYERSIAALLILEGDSNLKGEGGIKYSDGPVSFITDNNLKGISSNYSGITVEMSHNFSSENWDFSDGQIIKKVADLYSEWLGSKIIDYKIHRWKYSKPLISYNKRFEFLEQPGPIYLAGDSFMGRNVESAYLSGLHAARNLYEKFSYQLIEKKAV